MVKLASSLALTAVLLVSSNATSIDSHTPPALPSGIVPSLALPADLPSSKPSQGPEVSPPFPIPTGLLSHLPPNGPAPTGISPPGDAAAGLPTSDALTKRHEPSFAGPPPLYTHHPHGTGIFPLLPSGVPHHPSGGASGLPTGHFSHPGGPRPSQEPSGFLTKIVGGA